MAATPKLTICVPSRNRPFHFQETIRSLVSNTRHDVEFVFADNSDDGSAMRDFMVSLQGDERIRFLPSTGRILSMVDNWERCMQASTGDWISFIGDDDYVDPDVTDFIANMIAVRPKMDVLSWRRVDYNWPDNRPQICRIVVPITSLVCEMPRQVIIDDFFGWKHKLLGPVMPFGIYHSAVSRRVMRKIRKKFGNRYFEHVSVDYDNFSKLLYTADTFVYSERPFSITGSCVLSNSASIGTSADFKRINERTLKETGRNFDEDPIYADFPFRFHLGIPATVARIQHWFKKTYGYKVEGWQENFVQSCIYYCKISRDAEMFGHLVEGYRQAFSVWEGGRHLEAFSRPIVPYIQIPAATGVFGSYVMLDEDICGIKTPRELYELFSQMIVPIEDLKLAGTGRFTHEALAAA